MSKLAIPTGDHLRKKRMSVLMVFHQKQGSPKGPPGFQGITESKEESVEDLDSPVVPSEQSIGLDGPSMDNSEEGTFNKTRRRSTDPDQAALMEFIQERMKDARLTETRRGRPSYKADDELNSSKAMKPITSKPELLDFLGQFGASSEEESEDDVEPDIPVNPAISRLREHRKSELTIVREDLNDVETRPISQSLSTCNTPKSSKQGFLKKFSSSLNRIGRSGSVDKEASSKRRNSKKRNSSTSVSFSSTFDKRSGSFANLFSPSKGLRETIGSSIGWDQIFKASADERSIHLSFMNSFLDALECKDDVKILHQLLRVISSADICHCSSENIGELCIRYAVLSWRMNGLVSTVLPLLWNPEAQFLALKLLVKMEKLQELECPAVGDTLHTDILDLAGSQLAESEEGPTFEVIDLLFGEMFGMIDLEENLDEQAQSPLNLESVFSQCVINHNVFFLLLRIMPNVSNEELFVSSMKALNAMLFTNRANEQAVLSHRDPFPFLPHILTKANRISAVYNTDALSAVICMVSEFFMQKMLCESSVETFKDVFSKLLNELELFEHDLDVVEDLQRILCYCLMSRASKVSLSEIEQSGNSFLENLVILLNYVKVFILFQPHEDEKVPVHVYPRLIFPDVILIKVARQTIKQKISSAYYEGSMYQKYLDSKDEKIYTKLREMLTALLSYFSNAERYFNDLSQIQECNDTEFTGLISRLTVSLAKEKKKRYQIAPTRVKNGGFTSALVQYRYNHKTQRSNAKTKEDTENQQNFSSDQGQKYTVARHLICRLISHWT